jgi:hypothetical protein
MTVASRSLVGAQRVLSSRAEIVELLSSPTWCVSELFRKDPSDNITEPATPEMLTKLLKQAGLNSVGNEPKREAKLLKELDTQLTFVGHIAAVNTDGIEPLVRIGGPPLSVSYEQLYQPRETAPEVGKWSPAQLASESNGDYYVLREGLLHN